MQLKVNPKNKHLFSTRCDEPFQTPWTKGRVTQETFSNEIPLVKRTIKRIKNILNKFSFVKQKDAKPNFQNFVKKFIVEYGKNYPKPLIVFQVKFLKRAVAIVK